MSEYKTLDEWFPDGKPDGRKFVPHGVNDFWFQPFYRSNSCYWHGLSHKGGSIYFAESTLYIEYHPPKQTKKVKMYCAIYHSRIGYTSSSIYHSTKDAFEIKDIAGWMEMECEVEQ